MSESLRELDAEVAERVIGHTGVREIPGHPWQWVRGLTPEEKASYEQWGTAPEYLPLEKFSISWDAMKQVVEKMRDRFGGVDLEWRNDREVVHCVVNNRIRATGDAAPEAVCKAALKALSAVAQEGGRR